MRLNTLLGVYRMIDESHHNKQLIDMNNMTACMVIYLYFYVPPTRAGKHESND